MKLSVSRPRRRVFLLLILLSFTLHISVRSLEAGSPTRWLKVTPTRVPRGAVALMTYLGPQDVKPIKIARGDTTFPFFQNDKGAYQALLGLPLSAHGRHASFTVYVSKGESTEKIAFNLSTRSKKFPVRTLHLKKRAKLDAKTLKRIKRERSELLSTLKKLTPKRLWHGKFIKPVSGGVTSGFGVRRKINGTYMSVHHGVDFRAPLKTPVHAINAGTVVFLKRMVLSGLTIVVDHGMGLYSLYGHLSQARVKLKDRVEKGQVIGLSGNTGRSTGPHLHLGVTLCGISVDPLTLIHLPL